MEKQFIQWLSSQEVFKGMNEAQIMEAINTLYAEKPEEVENLINAFKKSVEKNEKGGKIAYFIDKYQQGGSLDRAKARENMDKTYVTRSGTTEDGTSFEARASYGDSRQGRRLAKAMATAGFENAEFDPTREFDRADFRARKKEAKQMGFDRHQRRAYALSELNRGDAQPSAPTVDIPLMKKELDIAPAEQIITRTKTFADVYPNADTYRQQAEPQMAGKYPLRPEHQPVPSQYEVMTEHAKQGTLGGYFSSVGNMPTPKTSVSKSTVKTTPTEKISSPQPQQKSWKQRLLDALISAAEHYR